MRQKNFTVILLRACIVNVARVENKKDIVVLLVGLSKSMLPCLNILKFLDLSRFFETVLKEICQNVFW